MLQLTASMCSNIMLSIQPSFPLKVSQAECQVEWVQGTCFIVYRLKSQFCVISLISRILKLKRISEESVLWPLILPSLCPRRPSAWSFPHSYWQHRAWTQALNPSHVFPSHSMYSNTWKRKRCFYFKLYVRHHSPSWFLVTQTQLPVAVGGGLSKAISHLGF